ncbi:MAG: hypothetical protein ACRETY_02020 [Steroidobacteraceae bacterium]
MNLEQYVPSKLGDEAFLRRLAAYFRSAASPGAGLHTGEIEIADGKVRGIAVHTGARIAASAQPGEILVSSTVRDLVAGSGLQFADRGMHALKDIPRTWQLFAAGSAKI